MNDTDIPGVPPLPSVSPRFGNVIPPNFNPTAAQQPREEDTTNPDEFDTRTINTQAPTHPDGTPMLAEPNHKVTPLDLATARAIVRQRAAQWEGADADAEKFSNTPQRHTVRDSTRKYAFTGVRLAYVSSEAPEKTRWTDIELYRTDGGIYIIHKVGVTTLVHLENCEQLVRYHKRHTPGIDGIASDELPPEERDACPDCQPDLDYMLHNEPAALKFERDRHQVSIRETPEGAVQALHTVKNGVKKLGLLAGSALQMASDREPMLAAIFYGLEKDTDK